MAGIPLEDNFTDIIGKAQRGLGLSDTRLSTRARVSIAQLSAAKAANPPLNPLRGRGAIDDAVIRKLASALNLGADALVASAKQTWYPADPGAIDGLACFNTPFSDMTVNAYLVFDPQTRRAAACDTGTDCDPMLKFARERELKIEMILLTHTHGDHVYDLDRLKEATGATAYVSEREPLDGAETFGDGHVFAMGGLKIETRRTSGHARGGTTFVVTGLPLIPSAGGVRPSPRRSGFGHAGGGGFLAVVGDALFAGSMGGGMVNHEEALRTNRESIFTLPDDTIICPGHGPLTTVGEEKLHNPFFPEFQQS